MSTSTSTDVIIIGAGAAGLMCAAEARKRGRRVIVLEHQNAIGKKILISGGGRCNFTNLHCKPDNFISNNPHFAKSALARYTPEDFVALVRKHKIPYHEKKLGQLFCDHSARDVVALLQKECHGAQILLSCSTQDIKRTVTHFVLETNRGTFEADALVIATGGLSIPKMGATSVGYDVATQFGLKVIPCRPALVPLTFSPPWADLAGVATDSIAMFERQAFRERILFTHRGVSGPSILQISSYWNQRDPIIVDLMPNDNGQIPRRLAERMKTLEDPRQWKLLPSGTEGYAKAEVTAGGVDTGDLSSKTFEAKLVPGLFFIGEVVDVTGHLGGFNFQWAWSSGYAAGQTV